MNAVNLNVILVNCLHFENEQNQNNISIYYSSCNLTIVEFFISYRVVKILSSCFFIIFIILFISRDTPQKLRHSNCYISSLLPLRFLYSCIVILFETDIKNTISMNLNQLCNLLHTQEVRNWCILFNVISLGFPQFIQNFFFFLSY